MMFLESHVAIFAFPGVPSIPATSLSLPQTLLSRTVISSQTVRVSGFSVGIQSFCKDLVEVADILEKTTECISEETEPADQKLTLEKIFRGLSLLEAKLKSVFAKHGLEKMTPIGDKYDPHEHELICHVPAGVGVQPGTVAFVRQDGYKLHGRTIRLAQVEVAVESQRRL